MTRWLVLAAITSLSVPLVAAPPIAERAGTDAVIPLDDESKLLVRELRAALLDADREAAFGRFDDALEVIDDALDSVTLNDDSPTRLARVASRLEELREQVELVRKLPKVGDKLKVDLNDLDGKLVDLSKLGSKLTLIDIWSREDQQSIADFDIWKQLVATRKPDEFQIVGLPIDADTKKIREVVATQHLTWRQVDNTGNKAAKLAKNWGVEQVPLRIVVDAGGKVVNIDPTAKEVRALLLREIGPVPASQHELVDDEARLLDFVAGVSRLNDRGECQSSDALLKRLTRACSRPRLAKLAPTAASEANPIDRARAATIMLGELYKCDECPDTHAAVAGGVLVSSDGLALTNHHVLSAMESGNTLGAMTYDGRCLAVVDVLAADEAADVALIRLAGDNLPFVPVASDPPAVLDHVFVVSHPQEHFFSCTAGNVTRYASDSLGQAGPASWMEITADYAEGSSGSGVFNERGEVVGLVCMTESLHASGGRRRNADLQMVVKHAVPLSAITPLIDRTEVKPNQDEAK